LQAPLEHCELQFESLCGRYLVAGVGEGAEEGTEGGVLLAVGLGGVLEIGEGRNEGRQ